MILAYLQFIKVETFTKTKFLIYYKSMAHECIFKKEIILGSRREKSLLKPNTRDFILLTQIEFEL